MKILIVDDERTQREILAEILSDIGFEVFTAPDGDRAAEMMTREDFPLVLTDLKMPGKNGIQLLQEALKLNPDTQVILMTAFGTIPSAVNAIKSGAYDYLTKPFEKEDLIRVVRRAAEKAHLLEENRRLKNEMMHRYGYHQMIGAGNAMREIFRLIERIKNVDATVLITGESGTGKELVARAIHYSGNRRNGTFVAINCGAIPENLIESELFGHVKGAFTGASRNHTGKFEQAHCGTIFLDEIATMPPHLQVKLLRVLQEKKIERVGTNTAVELDVRVVAATNENLPEKVKQRQFREDLYHRLNVFAIHLPPLRERTEDIPLLARHFIKKNSEKYGKNEATLSPAALSRLETYPFPGNVRELENIIEKTLILKDNAVIEAADLMIPEPVAHPTQSKNGEEIPLPELEREWIEDALRTSQGSIKKAAGKLGITYKTLQYRMKKFGFDKEDFKNR